MIPTNPSEAQNITVQQNGDAYTSTGKADNFQFDDIIAIKWLDLIAFDIIMVNCLMSCCWPHISTGLLYI